MNRDVTSIQKDVGYVSNVLAIKSKTVAAILLPASLCCFAAERLLLSVADYTNAASGNPRIEQRLLG